jgi:hypothetical protein
MWKRTAGISLLAVLVLAACGDSGEVAPTASVAPDNTREEPEPEAPEYAMLLEPVDDVPLTGTALTSTPVRVRLLDAASRAPMSGEMVGFELRSAPDEESSLSAATAVTDHDGVARVSLRHGPLAGTASIKVTHPDADALQIEFHVREPQIGSIRVDIVEPSNPPVDLAPFRLTFFEAETLACEDYVPRTRLPEAYLETNTPDSEPIVVEGFDGGATYTVVAEGLGSAGRALATGCADDIEVTASETVATTVPLELLPVSPSGEYVVNGVWDISEAVAQANDTAGTLVGVIEFLSDPATAIYDLVITEIENAIDFPIGIILGITGIQQDIINEINNILFQFEGLETFVAVADDLNGMLHELEVTSRLTIEKTDEDYHFAGHEEWTAITVHWDWRCENNPDPDCGIYVVDLEGDDQEAGEMSYDWLGRVDGYDDLLIDSHEAQLDVGRLQMYLLEKIMIPELTGGNATSLAGALSYWADCEGIAQQAIQGNDICDPTGLFCVGETLIEGACNAAMDQIAGEVLDPIDQEVLLDIEMAGTARLVDTSATGIADEIHEGDTLGTLVESGEQVTVTWSATR